MDNSGELLKLFINIVEADPDAKGLFEIDEDGIITQTVHTGNTIEACRLQIEEYEGSILITSKSFLCVNENNRKEVEILMKSINDQLGYGMFFVGGENDISYAVRCDLDDLRIITNPFDIIFLGCKRFEMYGESILKALCGTKVFFL